MNVDIKTTIQEENGKVIAFLEGRFDTIASPDGLYQYLQVHIEGAKYQKILVRIYSNEDFFFAFYYIAPMQLVALRAVRMAVATEAIICTIHFKVSFLVIIVNV